MHLLYYGFDGSIHVCKFKNNMMEASKSVLITILLLSAIAQYPVSKAVPLDDLTEEDAEMILADILNYQGFHSAFASNTGKYKVAHSISPDDFQVGYAVEATFTSPDKGKIHLSLMDDAENIVLQMTARYTKNFAALNTLIDGKWGDYMTIPGFDFTPGIPVKYRVEALPDNFHIFANGLQEAVSFPYRLPVTSISNIRLTFSDKGYEASINATLTSLSVLYNSIP